MVDFNSDRIVIFKLDNAFDLSIGVKDKKIEQVQLMQNILNKILQIFGNVIDDD